MNSYFTLLSDARQRALRIHHCFLLVDPVSHEFAFFSQQRASVLKDSKNFVQVNTQKDFSVIFHRKGNGHFREI